MKYQLFLSQSEKSKFNGCLYIYNMVIRDLFNSELVNITSIDMQMIKDHIDTYYMKEWDGVIKGDLTHLFNSN